MRRLTALLLAFHLMAAPAFAQLYVQPYPAGNDTLPTVPPTPNDCQNAPHPCRTLTWATQQALQATNLAYPITINMLGSFTESVAVNGWPRIGGSADWRGPVGLVYDGGSFSTTEWHGQSYFYDPVTGAILSDACFTLAANRGVGVGVRNITMYGDGNSCQSTIYGQREGELNILDGMLFGSAGAQIFHAEDLSAVQIWSTLGVKPGSSASGFMNAVTGAEINQNGGTIVFNASAPSLGTLFEAVDAHIRLSGSFIGTANGKAYNAVLNGVIDANGRCLTVLNSLAPVPGTTSTGGQCN